MSKIFVPSAQQATVFDWISNGSGSCVLEAVAGSGKTTTLIQAIRLMSGSIFFGAYNKKIAVEIQGKVPSTGNITVSTMHAAGFAAWRRATRFVKVDGDKLRNIFRAACERNMQYAKFERPVLQLVSLAKQAGIGIEGVSSIASRAAWMQLVNHYDIETFDENTNEDNTEIIIKLSIKTLEASIAQNMSIIDFDDMIYAPLYHGCKIQQYDWVLVDEAQDTNATRRLLAVRMMHATSRMIAVGDRHQAIYGFTGADAKALDLIADVTEACRLPLTVTYRCPKSVVSYAQQWVNHIQAHETAPEGTVRDANIADLLVEANVGDAVLCRFNAPLVENVYKFIAAGTPAKIEGREIGKGLIQLARRWKVKSLATLIARLDAFQEREVKKFEAKEQPAKVDAVNDKCNCLRVIIARVEQKDPTTKTPVDMVVAEIEAIFSDDGDNSKVVLLSSVHKSKGREWSKVVWLQTPPNKRATLDWMVEQEQNLNYVAATRAMSELVLMQVEKKQKQAV